MCHGWTRFFRNDPCKINSLQNFPRKLTRSERGNCKLIRTAILELQKGLSRKVCGDDSKFCPPWNVPDRIVSFPVVFSLAESATGSLTDWDYKAARLYYIFVCAPLSVTRSPAIWPDMEATWLMWNKERWFVTLFRHLTQFSQALVRPLVCESQFRVAAREWWKMNTCGQSRF